MNSATPTNQGGYIALASMLVIAAVVTIIGTTVALTSISEAQLSLSSARANQVLDLADGCAADALLFLNNNNSLPVTVTTPLGTCTVITNSQVGTIWNFTVTATLNGYTKKARIEAVRTATVSITSWQEVD